MDDLLLAALRGSTGAALAFSNGWRYGAPVLPGPVTRNDLYDIVPMDPEVMTVTLTGAEVLGMLEQNLERTFSCDPFAQMGGYVKRCQGLACYVKVENPPGHRVQACWSGGRRLDPAKRYRAAFVTVQGVPAGQGEDRAGTGIGAHAAMERLLADERPYRGGRAAAFRVILRPTGRGPGPRGRRGRPGAPDRPEPARRSRGGGRDRADRGRRRGPRAGLARRGLGHGPGRGVRPEADCLVYLRP